MQSIVSIVSWTLTALTILFFILQFAKAKGTKAHVVRGFSIPLLIGAVIANNTVFVSASRGFTWDFPFVLHTSLGMVGLVFLIITIVQGIRIKFFSGYQKGEHGRNARATILFFGLSLLAAIVTRLIR